MSFTAHNVVSLFRAKPQNRDWDNSELAQFFRVEAALRQAGIFVDTQRGVTDEGDPWFVYCRQDTGDVFLHIARFDGFYVAAGPGMNGSLMRKNFRDLLDELVRDNPVILQPSSNRRPGSDLYIHPSTLLIVAVATLFYKSAPVRAEDSSDDPLRQSETRSSTGFGMLSDAYAVALVSAMAIIAVLHHTHMDAPLIEDHQSQDLALLDNILFNFSDGHDDLPRFEGNVEPTGLIAGAVQGQEAVVTEQVADARAEATNNASLELQSLFGKFADTILAASSAVTDGAEVAVLGRHIAGNETLTAADEPAAADGAEKAGGHSSPSSSLIASTVAADLKDDGAIQQVSLASSTGQPATGEPVLLQVAALNAVPLASDVLASSELILTSGESGKGAREPDTSASVDDAIAEPVVPEAPPFYDIAHGGGMAVLLSPSHDADGPPPMTVMPVDMPVSIVGVANDVPLAAVA